MGPTTPLFRRYIRRLCQPLIWLPLAACAAAAPGAGAAAHGVTEIVLERDCFGCPTGTRIELRHDGTAVFTEVGNARRGTQDKVRQGRITARDFDALAGLLASRGFYAMAPEYQDPGVADGPWMTLRVVRGGQAKEVFARDEATPPDLRAVETAIDQLRADVFGRP